GAIEQRVRIAALDRALPQVVDDRVLVRFRNVRVLCEVPRLVELLRSLDQHALAPQPPFAFEPAPPERQAPPDALETVSEEQQPQSTAQAPTVRMRSSHHCRQAPPQASRMSSGADGRPRDVFRMPLSRVTSESEESSRSRVGL